MNHLKPSASSLLQQPSSSSSTLPSSLTFRSFVLASQHTQSALSSIRHSVQPSCVGMCDLCRALPVSVEPASGRLGPAGSPGSSTAISVNLLPTEPGAVVGELLISTAGVKEALSWPLGASVVQSSYQLVDEVTKAPVTEVSSRHACMQGVRETALQAPLS